MNKTKIKTMLMFALAILGGSVLAEGGVQVPSPSYWASFNGSLDSDKVESQGGFSLSGAASEYVDVGASESENKAWSVAGDRWGSQTILDPESGTFTLSVMAKLGTVDNGVLLSFVNNNSEKRGLVLRRGNENQMIVTTGTSTDPVITANVPNCGETYNNYVLVADNGELTLYVNGEPVKNENGEIVRVEVDASDLISGSNFQPGRRFGGVISGESNGNGAIDEMTVWKSTALSSEQVMELYYSYLGVAKTTKAVISLNVARYNGSDYNATDLDQKLAGLEAVPGAAWVNLNNEPNGAVVTNLFWSGTESASMTDAYSVSYSSKNTYRWLDSTDGFLKTYLDDGEIDGHRAQLTVAGIPFAEYSVIVYCATDEQGKKFSPVTVNGTAYTVNEGGVTVEGATSFGASHGLVAQYATTATGNAIKIDNLSGVLTVNGGNGPDGARGGIAAIQIVKTSDAVAAVPTMTIGGQGNSEVNWSTVENWADGNVADSGSAKIILQGDATLSIDRDIDLHYISVEGDYTLTVKRISDAVTAKIDSLIVDKEIVLASSGIVIGISNLPVIYSYKVEELASSAQGNVYIAGANCNYENPAVINHNGGSLTLDGSAGEEASVYYLEQSHSDAFTTVVISNATVTYTNVLGVGKANYEVAGSSQISTPSFVLSQGQPSRESNFLLKERAVVNVTGTSDVDSNQSSIMFGHWNGPSTFTIKDEAQFNAQSQVLVGKTGNNQTININGGTFTAKGIKASAGAGGTNILNINGGTLKLGSAGITSYGSTSISVNVGGNATFEATAETLPVSQSVNLAQDVSLTIKGYVKFTGVVSGAGSFIADGEGVVLDFGNANMEAFTGSYSVQNGATLILPAGAETGVSVPEGCTLKLSLSQEQLAKGYSSKANSPVSFVTREGDAVTDNVNGGVYAPFPVWTPVSADSSWSNSALWSSGSVPTTGDIVIDTSAMTEPISVQVPSGFASVIILGNDSILTSISFNGVPSSISVFGKVKLPVETINAVDTLDVKENVTLAVDVAEGEVAITKGISGNFAFVKTGAGTLKLNAEIVPNGGTVIEEGTLKFGTHYLGGGAYNSAANVRVKAGTIFDFNGKADSWMHDITLEEGSVLKNSGGNMGNGSRQLAGIILEGNATVEAVGNFGLVASGWGDTKLRLNGYCLTKVGAGNFWITKVVNTTAGTFRVKEGTLACVSQPSNMTGIKLSIEGNANLSLSVGLSGLASLKFRSNGSGNGVGFTGLQHLDAAIRPAIDAGLINPESLNVGDTVTLVNGSELTNNFAEVSVGGRFNATNITDAAVTATVGALKNFWHYDFNDGVMTKEAAKAEDSTYELGNWGDVNGDDKSIFTRNGKAALLYRNSDSQRFSVYWNNNTADKIPFYAGVMTAVSIIKPKVTDKKIIWALGSGNSGAFVALTVDNDNTISMISWANNTLTTLASVSGIKNLTKTFHFVAVEFTPEGTTLWVDDKKVTTDKIFPEGVGKVGQLASVHGNVPGGCGYTRLESDGCYLDDWTVYDAALKQSELRALRSRLTPRPFTIRVR